MSPTVAMGCIHPWGGPLTVGSHHLARCFVRHGWRVAYVSAPLTPLPRLAAPEPGQERRRAMMPGAALVRHSQGGRSR